MATLSAKNFDINNMSPGDELPILVKHITQSSIEEFARLASIKKDEKWKDLHTNEEFATQGMFAGTVLHGPATMAYVGELLEKAFPLDRLMAEGSMLDMRATLPIYPGDTISFTGHLTRIENVGDTHLINYTIIGTNQKSKVVAKAEGEIVYQNLD